LLLAGVCAGTGGITVALAIVPVAVVLLALGHQRGAAGGIRAETPFSILQLGPDATPDDIDLAYRTLVSRWLGRLTVDPDGAIRMLDAFERAYPVAIEAAFARTAGTQVSAGRASVPRRTDVSGRPDGGRTPGASRATGRTGRAPDDTGVSAQPPPALDVQRRLQAAFRAVGDDVPRSTEESGVRFTVVIESAAGARHIPVHVRPITVGAGGDFDIAVPGTPGEGPCSYARLWVSGRELVLHSSAAAACLVNDTQSSWARLEDGDRVEIAGLKLHVVGEREPAADA
jgi:hypothetical protein